MCGRYNFTIDGSDDKGRAILEMMEQRYPGQYKTGEIFPGDTAPAIVSLRGKVVPIPAVFGFPAPQGKRLLINARAETAAEKKTFAASLQTQRIILPASGFYEWSREEDKTKYYFSLEACPLLYLCGIYKIFEGKAHFVILTREANRSMIETHDRMPVIAEAGQVRPYLEDQKTAMEILAVNAPALNRREA